MEIKTEADGIEYPLDDRPSTGMYVFMILCFVYLVVCVSYARCLQGLFLVLCPQYWPSNLKLWSLHTVEPLILATLNFGV